MVWCMLCACSSDICDVFWFLSLWFGESFVRVHTEVLLCFCFFGVFFSRYFLLFLLLQPCFPTHFFGVCFFILRAHMYVPHTYVHIHTRTYTSTHVRTHPHTHTHTHIHTHAPFLPCVCTTRCPLCGFGFLFTASNRTASTSTRATVAKLSVSPPHACQMGIGLLAVVTNNFSVLIYRSPMLTYAAPWVDEVNLQARLASWLRARVSLQHPSTFSSLHSDEQTPLSREPAFQQVPIRVVLLLCCCWWWCCCV
jgi:hypothetical protein